jgi:hypothetical protein
MSSSVGGSDKIESKIDLAKKRQEDLFVARLLVTLISVVIVGLGIFSICTEHYYGRTSKLGGAEVILDGARAVKVGIGYCIFGLAPLSLWFKTPKAAGLFAGVCLVLGIGIILFL